MTILTKDEIIRMAREAGVTIRWHYDETGSTPQELERFAALVAAAEREECARVCDAASGRNFTLIRSETTEDGKHKRGAKAAALMEAAAVIRARGEK